MRALVLACAVCAACPRGGDNKTIEPTKRDAQSRLLPDGDGGAEPIALPPAPPVPATPKGLPPRHLDSPALASTLALGELLFHDGRLGRGGKTACATCHDPARGYAGAAPQPTATGKPNRRRAPTLVNLAYARELGWDGRYQAPLDQLADHVREQLGDDLATALARVAELPLYRAHFARIAQLDRAVQPTPRAPAEVAATALVLFDDTRYDGDSPWDRLERTTHKPKPGELVDPIVAGYLLFTGKAQCAACHAPPLYTDLAYHAIGLVGSRDPGRGALDARRTGAFKTPTLRGAAARAGFFHDGSAPTLEAAIDWHLAGGTGQGADAAAIDPALVRHALGADDRAHLIAFVRALTRAAPAPQKPALP